MHKVNCVVYKNYYVVKIRQRPYRQHEISRTFSKFSNHNKKSLLGGINNTSTDKTADTMVGRIFTVFSFNTVPTLLDYMTSHRRESQS
jgi:hypothetical protein